MVIQCCACKRVHDDNGWQETVTPLPDNTLRSHGYCPACEAKAYAELNRHAEILKSLSAA